jgi:hypothetical protein
MLLYESFGVFDGAGAASAILKCPVGWVGLVGRLDGLVPFLSGGLFCGMQTFEHPLKQQRPWLGQSTSGTPGDQHVDCEYEEQVGRVGNFGQTFLFGLYGTT